MLLQRLLGYVSLRLPSISAYSTPGPSSSYSFSVFLSSWTPLRRILSTRHQNRCYLTRSPSYEPITCLFRQLIPDWLKWDSWVREQRNRLLSIWENSTQEWAYDQGISPRLSIAKGKIVPKGAKEEHQRQKALGWDVSGNLGTGTEKEI